MPSADWRQENATPSKKRGLILTSHDPSVSRSGRSRTGPPAPVPPTGSAPPPTTVPRSPPGPAPSTRPSPSAAPPRTTSAASPETSASAAPPPASPAGISTPTARPAKPSSTTDARATGTTSPPRNPVRTIVFRRPVLPAPSWPRMGMGPAWSSAATPEETGASVAVAPTATPATRRLSSTRTSVVEPAQSCSPCALPSPLPSSRPSPSSPCSAPPMSTVPVRVTSSAGSRPPPPPSTPSTAVGRLTLSTLAVSALPPPLMTSPVPDCPPQLVPVPGEGGAQYKYCSPSAPLNDAIQGCGANRHCQFSTNLERYPPSPPLSSPPQVYLLWPGVGRETSERVSSPAGQPGPRRAGRQLQDM